MQFHIVKQVDRHTVEIVKTVSAKSMQAALESFGCEVFKAPSFETDRKVPTVVFEGTRFQAVAA